jgi:hypothetical protein
LLDSLRVWSVPHKMDMTATKVVTLTLLKDWLGL